MQEGAAMFQQYISYLSEIGFYPVDNVVTRHHCGYSYDLDAALGKGHIWCYGVDKLYGIVVSDFVFDCDVPAQFAHSPFFLVGLTTFIHPQQRQEGRQRNPGLFTYVGQDDVFRGVFEKGVTVRNINVSFLPDFYNDFLPGRYPSMSNLEHVVTALSDNDIIPGAVEVLQQLGSFRPAENIARMYYDSKVTELFSMMMQREINRQALSADNPVPESDLANLHQVMTYLNAHYTEDIYLKTLARYAGMSQTKLTSLFKRVYGTTISDHISTLRINLARDMLANSNKKIEVVAHTVGYRFHGNFSAAFKDATGLTPKQYRKIVL